MDAAGDGDLVLAIGRRHGDLRAADGLAEGNRQIEEEVEAAALEQRVGLDLQGQQQIAGLALGRLGRGGLALALEAQLLAVGGAGGDAHLDVAPAEA